MASGGGGEVIHHNTINNESSNILLQAAVNYGNIHTKNEGRMQAAVNYGHTFNFIPPKTGPKIKKINYDIPLNLPFARNPNFAGRTEEMMTISKSFSRCFLESNSSSAPAICAITGTGGMGKTQTALEYAYASRERHHLTAVFWISAATVENIQTSFVNIMQRIVEEQARVSWPESPPDYKAIAHSLGIPGLVDKSGRVSFDPEIIDSIRFALFNWLNLPGNSKWLLIFDNVDDLTVGIRDYFPTHGGGGVLVTSRRREFSQFAEQIVLNGLDKESSICLLLQLARLKQPTENDRGQAAAVVEKLGYMPLAISHAGCFIHIMNIAVDEYPRYYERAFKIAQSQVPDLGWAYGNETAVTAWEVSFLAVQQQDAEAASLLLSCSYLDRNEIFERLWEDGESTDVAAQLEQKKKFSLLASYSLIDRNYPGTFSIHPVVHEWARERVNGEERFQYIRGALRLLRRPILQKQTLQSQGRWDPGEERRIMSHAMVLCGYLDTGFIQHELKNQQPDTIGAINSVASVFYNQSSPETLATARVMASILDHQGKHNEALEQYQRMLTARKALNGQQFGYDIVSDEDPAALDLLHDMATSLYNLGRYSEALKYYQEALVGKQKVLGKYHSSTLITLNNMAAILSDQGRIDEAMDQYQKILVYQENSPHRDERSILGTTNSIAALLNKQGRFEEALEYHQKALAGMQKVLDPNHTSIFSTTRDIASVLSNLGKDTEALEWYYKALNGFERVLGPTHPKTLTVAGQIATVFQGQGLYGEALKLYKRTLITQEQFLGLEHPSTLKTIHDIGSVLRCQQKYDEALEQYQIALKGREELLGGDHPDTLVSIYWTGLVLLDQKKYDESIPLFYRALAGFEALGQNHSATSIGAADVMERIALVFVNQGKYKEALKWCTRSLETREKTLGKDHPVTITAAKTVANCKKTIFYQKGCIIT
ncbi:hypothetical protein TWF191_008012 [Orbilia oligospora]|uniref:Uncharacterized protein n=1 Tax=Orbilia oligospora TaxID=2813651 RepID=A0A7C8QMA9_ORBOL|nr:hypothetical protein TWF191_008012 [Orbilia oligospora]